MKGIINTLKNIYKIEDLRSRIFATLGFILIYRVGTYVVLPGINPEALTELEAQGSGGILGLVNLFAGGAFSRASVFALGIMPYISASIAVQLLTLAIPYFQKLQKEGESGRRQINQITRYLTVLITGAQASAYVINLKFIAGNAIVINPALFWLSTVIVLTAGTIFVMWLGEKITDKGIGNGISLIIMIGIIANLPFALVAEFNARVNEGGGGGLVSFLIEIGILVGIVVAVILLVQGTRRIPVQYAKRIVGQRQYGGVRQYIPLKVNAAGVMPIIFAQALMFLPATLAQFFPTSDATSGFIATFNDFTSVPYNVVYFFLVIIFTYFYTALIVNPVQMADDMKKNGGFIPGVKPGKKTAEFIDAIMSRITLPGSVFLALVAITPAFAMIAGVNSQFAIFYGGTSLLIMVAVVLDTLQQIESHLLMRHYDGLMKSGRIKVEGRLLAPVCNMIYYKTKEEIELIRESSLLVSKTLAEVARFIKPGVSSLKLDEIAEEFIRAHDGEPAFKGYRGFPNSLCISVNDQVVHGIPSKDELKDGDVVSVDCGIKLNGFYGDSAYTFAIGDISDDVEHLLIATKESLFMGIDKAVAGNRVGDISFAIQNYLENERNYYVVRELVGHGLGKNLHEDPEVPNFGRRGTGPKLNEGLVIAIEPMVNLGTRKVIQLDDGWTIRTADNSISAHYELAVAIQKTGADILSTFSFIEEAVSKNEELKNIITEKEIIAG